MESSQTTLSNTKQQRTFKGVVVSEAMNKTRIVLVSRSVTHPKYNKRYKVSRRYPAHDEKNEYKVGQEVVIQETRPLSKTKRWKIISHLK